jgi:electron transfer flavoprotein alpha subunit
LKLRSPGEETSAYLDGAVNSKMVQTNPKDTGSDLYRGVWVFADHRNYFQDRVTLQILAKARDLARDLETEVSVVVLGYDVHEYVMEYVAHGADIVYLLEDKRLKKYHVEIYTSLVCQLVERYKPEILLVGATEFGREFAPRVAKRLSAGLSADCVALEVDQKERILLQTTPSFEGNVLAVVVSPDRRPQMATVRPGVFRELKHDYSRKALLIRPDVDLGIEDSNMKVLRTRKQPHEGVDLRDASIVICGGRGMAGKKGFRLIEKLGRILGAEVGATRPPVSQGWVEAERLIGQTGKTIKPKLLITCGTSGAVQYTTAIQSSDYVIAINRDPDAPIFQMADFGAVGDANQILHHLIRSLEKRGHG